MRKRRVAFEAQGERVARGKKSSFRKCGNCGCAEGEGVRDWGVVRAESGGFVDDVF